MRLVLGLLASLVLTAAPMKIAVPDVSFSGLTNAEGNALVEFFSERLAVASGAQVVTPSMMAALMGLERQRQLLGCDEGSACLAELANAMGVDFVVAGSLVKLGGGFTVTLRLVDTRTAQARLSASERSPNEDALSTWLAATAARWGEAIAVKAPVSPVVPLSVGIVGGVAAVAGVVMLGLAGSYATQLSARPSPFLTAQAFADAARAGSTFQLGGLVALVAGVALGGVGFGWWALGAAPATASLVPNSSLAWSLP